MARRRAGRSDLTAEQPVTTKRDRDAMFIEYTKSVCPVCKAVVAVFAVTEPAVGSPRVIQLTD